jgi:hypothetical protein
VVRLVGKSGEWTKMDERMLDVSFEAGEGMEIISALKASMRHGLPYMILVSKRDSVFQFSTIGMILNFFR